MFTSLWLNFSIIVVIAGVVLAFVGWRVFNGNKTFNKAREYDREHFSLLSVELFLQERIKEMMSVNLYNMGLSPEEFKRQKLRLQSLEDALKNCNTGDLGSKVYVKDFLYDHLVTKFDYNQDNINLTIPFNTPVQLDNREIFDIVLHIYAKEHGSKALGVMIDEYDLAEVDETGRYRIEGSQIRKIYKEKVKSLTFEDKLQIIVQRIYSNFKGFGVIDEVRDMSIDGVSGGVSGLPPRMENFDDEEDMLNTLKSGKTGLNSVWIMYKGKSIHLTFLKFDREAELRRVVTLVYKYNSPGQLSEAKPYIINEMYDNSRVTVMRPPFSESWAFFIRKKYDMKKTELGQLFPHPNAELPITMMKFIMKGDQVTAFTGAQGCGKTTLLMGAVEYIRKTYNKRVHETAFELNLRSIYPDDNILTFQETDSVSGQEGMDLGKKTDGDGNILGEVATDPVAAWMIQAAQVSSFTVFTHHAKTFQDLIESIRNSLVKSKVFTDAQMAEEQVVKVLEWDIHLEKDYYGTRYIERITECIKLDDDDVNDSIVQLASGDSRDRKIDVLLELATKYLLTKTRKRNYVSQNIVEFVDGKYVAGPRISIRKQKEIEKHLSVAEREEFQQFIDSVWGSAA